MRRVRTSLVIVLGVAVCGALATGMVAAAAADWASNGASNARDDAPAVVVEEAGGLVYEYHVFTGREFLWRADAGAADRRNLARDLPDDARRLRRACELRLRIDSLDALHEPHREAAAALHGLGYL